MEYFTNQEILDAETDNLLKEELRSKGFIETQDIATRSDADFFPGDGIGAFSITSSDGKTYHYSLPVYQFETFLRSYPDPTKDEYIEQRKLDPYAYTWLLTSITGSDYVDRGSDGSPNREFDEYDYGYWVKFSYGKWSDGFIWQLPYDDMGKSYPYHWGRKQVYYLNSVQTRTHTAYFVKSLREDGKGAFINSTLFDLPANGMIAKEIPAPAKIYDIAYEWDDYDCTDNPREDFVLQCFTCTLQYKFYADIEHTIKEASLKLDKIILVENSSPKLEFLGQGIIQVAKMPDLSNWICNILG